MVLPFASHIKSWMLFKVFTSQILMSKNEWIQIEMIRSHRKCSLPDDYKFPSLSPYQHHLLKAKDCYPEVEYLAQY